MVKVNKLRYMFRYKAIEANIEQFIEFWSLQYEYAEEHLYDDNIGLELTNQRIFDLYRWKNGRRLSEQKRNSIYQNYIKRRDELQQFQNIFSAKDFLYHFDGGGPIWRIFWLHCFRPNEFPIYDQHVHRAMVFIENGVIDEIPKHASKKINSYLVRYLPFYNCFSIPNSRAIDKALWAFGKFIKENNFPKPAFSIGHS